MAIRLCVYNIEWFDDLFEADNSMKTTQEAQGRFGAIRDVLAVVDPDILGIVEAPNTTTTTGNQDTTVKLANFGNFAGLRTTSVLTGFISAGRQELAVMFDPNVLTVDHNPSGGTKTNPRFDDEFHVDTDEDRIPEIYKMYRPPLEADVTVTSTGQQFKLMLVHTKSKGIFSTTDFLHWQRENERNRRKLFGEAIWIRRRVDEWLGQGHSVVVLGDINDGPGMDAFELQFAKSAVEIIVGDLFAPEAILKSHIGKPKWGSYGWKPSSARFKDRLTEDYVNVLIDHILASQDLSVAGQNPHKVWNPFQDDDAKANKNELLAASDHFPVSLDLDLG